VGYIETEYSQDINLDGLAQTFYYSPAYLSYIFKKELGTTVTDYLTKIRIKEAKNKLIKTNDTIVSIAKDVGFHSESYFNRVFKKHVGMPPGEFRQAIKTEN